MCRSCRAWRCCHGTLRVRRPLSTALPLIDHHRPGRRLPDCPTSLYLATTRTLRALARRLSPSRLVPASPPNQLYRCSTCHLLGQPDYETAPATDQQPVPHANALAISL